MQLSNATFAKNKRNFFRILVQQKNLALVISDHILNHELAIFRKKNKQTYDRVEKKKTRAETASNFGFKLNITFTAKFSLIGAAWAIIRAIAYVIVGHAFGTTRALPFILFTRCWRRSRAGSC